RVGTPFFSYPLFEFEGKRGDSQTLAIDKITDGTVISQFWSNATYCVYWSEPHTDFDGHGHLPRPRRLELYRLPPVPLSYRSSFFTRMVPVRDYQFDFLRFLNGDRKNNPGFQYELIYADPPVTSQN